MKRAISFIIFAVAIYIAWDTYGWQLPLILTLMFWSSNIDNSLKD